MGYIYQILQDDKPVYVGQTIKQISERWYEHVYLTQSNKGYEIHNKMRKIGINHFHIELLEETDELDEREIFWIEKLQTHFSVGGCNLTRGGQTAAEKNKKPCYQYDLNGNFLREFESIKDASRFIGKNHRNISNTLMGKFNTAYGYRWSYDKVEKLPPLKSNHTGVSKEVYQYDLNGAFIAKYESTKEAAKALGKSQGNISSAANGKRKTAYGFVWSYDYIMNLAGY